MMKGSLEAITPRYARGSGTLDRFEFFEEDEAAAAVANRTNERGGGGQCTQQDCHSQTPDVENEAIQKALAADGGNEQAKALWGAAKFEQRDYEKALFAFRGLSLPSVKSRLMTTVELFRSSKRMRAKAQTEGISLSAHHAAILLNAFLCQAKCLDKLGHPKEGAEVCKEIVKVIGDAFPHGFSHPPVCDWATAELTDLIFETLVTLPRLHRRTGEFMRAINAYRRALVSPLSLSQSFKGDVQKELALELIYAGFQAPPPLTDSELLTFNGQLSSYRESTPDVFAPANNTEEAVLLLMLLQHDAWDQGNAEHLCFALSTSVQFELVAKLYEDVKPGVYSRPERWYSLALSHLSAGNKDLALNVIGRAARECPNDVRTLLLAGKLCSRDVGLACKGLAWAEKAVANAMGNYESLRGKAYHVLGVVLGVKAKAALSDTERQKMQSRALEALHKSAALELGDADVVYDLARQYAEMRQIVPALQFAREALDWSNGTHVKAWRLVALLLSSQRRWEDAMEVCYAGLDAAMSKCEEGLLLRTMAKIQVVSEQYKMALDTYKKLLAMVQIQGRKVEVNQQQAAPRPESQPSDQSPSPSPFCFEDTDAIGVREADVWADLTEVYIALRQWDDAFTCVDHPCLSRYEPKHWYVNGLLEEAQDGDNKEEALASYENALAMEPSHAPSMIRMGILHCHTGGASLPLARSFLTDALHEDPTDHVAWHALGLVHKQEGRMSEAADCFSAALRMQLTAPAMSFSSLPRGL